MDRLAKEGHPSHEIVLSGKVITGHFIETYKAPEETWHLFQFKGILKKNYLNIWVSDSDAPVQLSESRKPYKGVPGAIAAVMPSQKTKYPPLNKGPLSYFTNVYTMTTENYDACPAGLQKFCNIYYLMNIAMDRSSALINMERKLKKQTEWLTFRDSISQKFHRKNPVLFLVITGNGISNWSCSGPRTKSFRCLSFVLLEKKDKTYWRRRNHLKPNGIERMTVNTFRRIKIKRISWNVRNRREHILKAFRIFLTLPADILTSPARLVGCETINCINSCCTIKFH